MGGAAGHIKHIWENTDLTFKDLKIIINNSLDGKLGDTFEKIDGQNIMVTYKDNKALSARTSSHLKNFGKDALDIEGTNKYFERRGNPLQVEKMFVNVLEDFQQMFNEFPEFAKIFKDGKCWANVEIVCQENENIIPYFDNKLIIHHIKELDENGKTIKIFNTDFISKRYKTFLIREPNKININPIDELIKQHINKKFIELISDFTEEQTIKDYLELNFFNYINNNLNEDNEFKILLSKRWGRGDKSINISKLLKDRNQYTKTWIKDKDDNLKQIYHSILFPFIYLFSYLGIILLKNIDKSNILTSDYNKSIQTIKEKLLLAIPYVNNEIINQYDLYTYLGGETTIVPIEGIVFKYNNDTYKLTGSFTYILRIIGNHKFNNKINE